MLSFIHRPVSYFERIRIERFAQIVRENGPKNTWCVRSSKAFSTACHPERSGEAWAQSKDLSLPWAAVVRSLNDARVETCFRRSAPHGNPRDIGGPSTA